MAVTLLGRTITQFDDLIALTLRKPAHEIMALSFLHTLILQTRICSSSVGPEV